MRENPKPLQVYKHFKGTYYQVIDVAKHSETGEYLVIYRPLFGGGDVYARPLEMFLSEVDHEKYPDVRQKYRFALATGVSRPGKDKQEAPAEDKEEGLPENNDPEDKEDAGCDNDFLDKFLDADSFEEKLDIFTDMWKTINENNIDYGYVCSVAKCMKTVGFFGLVLIDEFDNFSTIASKATVGNLRTLFSSSDYGIRAVIASRRMVERIEREVEGAVNANVSTLAPIFINGSKLKMFNDEDMVEYWTSIARKIGCNLSEKYIQEVQYYVGSHPCLLNLLNGCYWAEQESKDYISNDSTSLSLNKELLNKLHDAFDWAVWRDMEKWQLLRSLILSTWGPDENIPNEELSELDRYGVISKDQILTEPDGPIRIAISRYFTEWMNIKRYILPFGDEWSKAEGNMRKIVKCFCDDMYQGDEPKMIAHLETKNVSSIETGIDPRYTAKGRFDSMRKKMERNINKYPDMSSSIIDYSDPSDLPEIFFKREWEWFGQVFGNTWKEWSGKFFTMNEVRNIKSHNNLGFPQSRIELAKKYCHEVNEKIESFIHNRQ